MEIKNVKCVRVDEPIHSDDRGVWLSKYKLHKVKVLRNVYGVVVKEVPFVEYVFRLFVVGKTVWLSERLLVDLKEVLEELERPSAPPPLSAEEEIRDDD